MNYDAKVTVITCIYFSASFCFVFYKNELDEMIANSL